MPELPLRVYGMFLSVNVAPPTHEAGDRRDVIRLGVGKRPRAPWASMAEHEVSRDGGTAVENFSFRRKNIRVK